MMSSTTAVARCTAIASIGVGPRTNAVTGRSTMKNIERAMRPRRVRSLPRATAMVMRRLAKANR